MNEAGEIMRNLNYNLGFTLESGAEKIALIDQRGKWYSSQRLLSIVTKLFLETNKDKLPFKIAISITATNEIDLIAKEYDVEVVRIRNNHSAMMEATTDEKIKFVGGIYGGFIFPEFLFASDGMYSVGKIIEMLAQTQWKLSEIDDMIPVRYQEVLSVECPWSKRGQIMRSLMNFSENKKRELIEGVKIFDGDESVLFMPAKETASFNIYAESDSKEKCSELINKYRNQLNIWLKE
jgi:mannose-1-phosphate guanylyltransferase/phosphomannomutase